MTRFQRLLWSDIVPMENEPLAVRADAMTPKQRAAEYCRPELDSVGDWFIGFGTSILHGLKTHKYSDAITIEHALDAARAEIYEASEVAPKLVEPDSWEALNEVRRDVLILMVYQMGFYGVKGFPSMRARINDGNYEAAAAEMMDSKWARNDSPRRAACLADRMRTGQWKSIQDYRRAE